MLLLDRHADPEHPNQVTKAEIEAHFGTHGTGEITEIKLMNGFGFIEYKDAMDARDVVPGKLDIYNPSSTCADPPSGYCLAPMANVKIHAAFRTSPSHPLPQDTHQLLCRP